MLHFVLVGLLIPLSVLIYIRHSKSKSISHMKKYVNPYLEEYLVLDPNTPPQDQYKLLSQAASYLLNYEEELEEETKNLSILFHGRMIGNTLWSELKSAKEELDYEKLTIEAELGRYAKISKGTEPPRPQKQTLYKDIHPEDNSDLKKALYRRYMMGKKDNDIGEDNKDEDIEEVVL